MDPGVTLLEKIKEMQEDRVQTHIILAELESEIKELRTADRYRALVTLAMWGKEKIKPLFKPDSPLSRADAEYTSQYIECKDCCYGGDVVPEENKK